MRSLLTDELTEDDIRRRARYDGPEDEKWRGDRTVAEVCKELHDVFSRRAKADGSIRESRRMAAMVTAHFPKLFKAVRREHVEALEKLITDSDWKPCTQRRYCHWVRKVCKYAAERGYIRSNPAYGLKALPKASEADRENLGRIRVLSLEQVQALFPPDTLYGFICLVLWETGMRPGELLGERDRGNGPLPSDSVINRNGAWYLRVDEKRSKVGLSRLIPLGNEQRATVMREFLEALNKEVERHASPNAFVQCFQIAIRKNSEKLWGKEHRITTYTMRHSALTRMLREGYNATTVATMTGTSVAMLQRHYFHIFEDLAVAEMMSATQRSR